jgi:hypothetical protein
MRPLEGAKGQGPPEAAGPSNGTRQRARSEDHAKMQRLRTRGMTADGETKWQVSQQSPRHQSVMMARHFSAERCADAPIPALGFDALKPATPFKCSLLDTSGTSPSSSRYYSFLRHFPEQWIPPPPPSPMDLAWGQSAVGAPRAAGTRRRSPPDGHPAPEVPCASGRRRRARRTAPPQGPLVP